MEYIELDANPKRKKRMTENRATIFTFIGFAIMVILYLVIVFVVSAKYGTSEMYIIFLGASVVCFAFILFSNFLTRKIWKGRHEINSAAVKKLTEGNFNITKTFEFLEFNNGSSNELRNKMFFVDSTNKRIGFINYNQERLIIVQFNDVLSYDVYENDSELTRGNSITGGKIFGKRSLLATSSFSSRSQKMCNDLRLNIRLKSLETSQISYDIIADTAFNYGWNTNSKKYRNVMSSLQEVVSFLEALIDRNMNHDLTS